MSTDAPLETTRCDHCQCLLSTEERANYRDTGFAECNECYARRVSAAAWSSWPQSDLNRRPDSTQQTNEH